MPINAGYEYAEAQKKLNEARTTEDKIKALEHLLSVSPSHKGSEKLRAEIKTKIAKLKTQLERQTSKKSGGKSIAIKKEGAAQVVLIGTTMSGKSLLLSRITNVRPRLADHEFTTKEPEVGIMDYNGIKIQLIEIPAIVPDFYHRERGPTYLSIIRGADLIVLLSKNEDDKKMILKELYTNNIDLPLLYYNNEENIKDLIWGRLNLIHVFTKQPGKKPDFPPVALKKGRKIRDLAGYIHKDFLKKFKYAKIYGKSVKHSGMVCGLGHVLADGDVVELHMR